MTTLNFRKIALFGMSQSGKSTMMNSLMRNSRRVVLFDEVVERMLTADKENLIQINTVEQLKLAIMGNYHKGFRYWFRPVGETNMVKALSDASRALMEIQEWWLSVLQKSQTSFDMSERPDILFAVDEMADCYPNQKLSGDNDHFSVVCRRGRHSGIQLIGASQRPADVGVGFRAQADTNYIFSLKQPRDLQAVAEMIGGNEGRQIAEEVRTLEVLEYIRYQDGKKTRGKLTFN